jgi:hypothetical protein
MKDFPELILAMFLELPATAFLARQASAVSAGSCRSAPLPCPSDRACSSPGSSPGPPPGPRICTPTICC